MDLGFLVLTEEEFEYSCVYANKNSSYYSMESP